MGTRSITVVKDEQGNKIIEMYKQYDGYPEAMMVELSSFISSGTLVNGIPAAGQEGRLFNGMGCLAAQLVEHFKEGAGGIYLHTPTKDYKYKKKYWDLYWAEYYYEIDHTLTVRGWDTYTNEKVYL